MPKESWTLHVHFRVLRRALDFVKQQQTAMKLHRLDRSCGDHLWWIVTSLVLQSRAEGAEPLLCMHGSGSISAKTLGSNVIGTPVMITRSALLQACSVFSSLRTLLIGHARIIDQLMCIAWHL